MKKLFCAAVLATLPMLSHAGLGVSATEFSERFNQLDDVLDSSYPAMRLTTTKGTQSVNLIKGQTLTVTKSAGGADIDKIALKCPNSSRHSDSCGRTMIMIAHAINLDADSEGLLNAVIDSSETLRGEFVDGDVLTKWSINVKANTITATYTEH